MHGSSPVKHCRKVFFFIDGGLVHGCNCSCIYASEKSTITRTSQKLFLTQVVQIQWSDCGNLCLKSTPSSSLLGILMICVSVVALIEFVDIVSLMIYDTALYYGV